ncbi:MAG: uroporphyrinogen-III C-methyltransferase [Rhodospirillales bacterium]|nr:MAG: uroporphyrinogen-III C-methyltransferase [Rhodospirillales bacterium]
MKHFPVFLEVEGRTAVVVGGGETAARKVRLLRAAGAAVRVIAPSVTDELASLERAGEVTLIRRLFHATDVADAALVISATARQDVDAAVAAAAGRAGVPVNVVDNKALSSFIVPAIVDRHPITVAISSGGTAPVLARNLRARIEAMLPPRLGQLARFADSFRTAVKASIPDGIRRRRFWERLFAGPIAAAVLAGDETRAREAMLSAVNRPPTGEGLGQGNGIVFIVGAGPGDPDLLTLKALRLLQEADVIVHDRLVTPAILDYARRDAEVIDVGKAKGSHACSQGEINRILLREASAGRRVVRLKGGDPFVFGRGGEERDHLRTHGIAVEVVPGITAATGCAATAGIPLTHRDHAQALTLVTGHGRDGEPDLDWPALAGANRTVAVYMGATAAGRIAERLIGHGMAPDTPAAVIADGTRPGQQTRVGPVRALAELAAGIRPGAPALLLIGEVVRHADAWMDVERRTQDRVTACINQ